jgi:hypothetical protein
MAAHLIFLQIESANMRFIDEGLQKIPLLAVIPKTFVKDTEVPVKDGMRSVFQAYRFDGNIGTPPGFSVNLATDPAAFLELRVVFEKTDQLATQIRIQG